VKYYADEQYDEYIEVQRKKSLVTKKRTRRHSGLFRYLLSQIREFHPEAKSILCVGCRDDYEIEFFENEGFHVTGIDLHSEGKVIACDMSKIEEHPNLSKGVWDIFLAAEVLEHCMDLSGFVRSLQKQCQMGFYASVPLREEPSIWDVCVHGFMDREITEEEIPLYFPGFKTCFKLAKNKSLFFGLSKEKSND
jgi:hypothetical protein